jgi:DNA repair protein RadC
MKYKIPSEFKITRVRECAPAPIADTAAAMHRYWEDNIKKAEWYADSREHLVVILLNARLRVIGHHLVGVGIVSECPFHPRESLRPAIMHSAYAFTIMHNHPGGDPSPSRSDHLATTKLRDAAQIMQINLIDHVIVGDSPCPSTPYYSFREAGIL